MKLRSEAKTSTNPSDGVKVYYWLTWKKEMPKNFVLLHPASSCNHTSLEPLEELLNEQGHPTLTFDWRGQGYSDAPKEPKYYTLDRLSSDIGAIVEKEGLEKPILSGHSIGFMVISDYAANTGNASHIIGMAGSHKFSETAASFLAYKAFRLIIDPLEYAASITTGLAHRIKSEERGYPEQARGNDLELWISLIDMPINRIKAHSAFGKAMGNADITGQLKRITTPILLIYGNRDAMVTAKAGTLINQITNAPCRIEIIDGTHSFPITRPHQTANIIYNFIASS